MRTILCGMYYSPDGRRRDPLAKSQALGHRLAMHRASRRRTVRGTIAGAIIAVAVATGAAERPGSTAVVPVPAVPLPGYRATQAVPPFGTTVTRITGDPGTPIPELGGTWGPIARHHYSKDQPWNADQTLIAIQNGGGAGSPKKIYLDAKTYLPRRACPEVAVGDDRWHPARAHARERINVRGNVLQWFDVATCAETRRWTLPFEVDAIGMGEGNPSFDGRFLVLGDSRRMFVVDMDPRPPHAPYPAARIGPIANLVDCGWGACQATWVSISPSGKYAVVHYKGEAIQVWDVDPETLSLSPRRIERSYPGCQGVGVAGFVYSLGHADMTLDPFDGDEDVIVGQEKCGNRGATIDGKRIGGVVLARLRDGAIKSLTDPKGEAAPHHVSTRSFAHREWAYVSYYAERPTKRFNDEIVAVKLDGSGAVERLAHQHSRTPGCYRCETHAVPSPDGRFVLFASDWMLDCGSRCGTQSVVSAYVVAAE